MSKRVQAGLVATALTLLSLAIAYLMLAIVWWQYATASELQALSTAPTNPTHSEFRHDIRHCFEDDEVRDLWDCVRDKEVSE
jgi:hypothetical protein